MYYTGYNRLFWGMVLVIFNINIGPINILPDFIGYLMINSALGMTSAQNGFYSSGKIPSLVLAALTVKDIIVSGNNNILSSQSIDIIQMCISALVMLINVYLVYIICRGMWQVSIEKGKTELKELIEGRWKFYMVTAAVFTFITPFTININEKFRIVIALFAIVYLIAGILILGLISRAKKELAE